MKQNKLCLVGSNNAELASSVGLGKEVEGLDFSLEYVTGRKGPTGACTFQISICTAKKKKIVFKNNKKGKKHAVFGQNCPYPWVLIMGLECNYQVRCHLVYLVSMHHELHFGICCQRRRCRWPYVLHLKTIQKKRIRSRARRRCHAMACQVGKQSKHGRRRATTTPAHWGHGLTGVGTCYADLCMHMHARSLAQGQFSEGRINQPINQR